MLDQVTDLVPPMAAQQYHRQDHFYLHLLIRTSKTETSELISLKGLVGVAANCK